MNAGAQPPEAPIESSFSEARLRSQMMTYLFRLILAGLIVLGVDSVWSIYEFDEAGDVLSVVGPILGVVGTLIGTLVGALARNTQSARSTPSGASR
jgi:hypothetical protein